MDKMTTKILRPSVEKIFREIAATVKRHGLRENWHGVGRLLDCLTADKHDDIVAVVSEALYSSNTWTRSAFIAPALQFLREKLNEKATPEGDEHHERSPARGANGRPKGNRHRRKRAT